MSGVVGRWSASTWLARRWMRRRWLVALPIALVIAASTAASMAALTAAQRTSSAYDDFLDRSNAGDVQINASLPTEEIDAFIRALPQAEHVTSHAFFNVTGSIGGHSTDFDEPRTRAEFEMSVDAGDPLAASMVIGSSDGRFIDMDRPVVRAGRMATDPNEAVVDEQFARVSGIAIGDVVELAFWASTATDPSRALGLTSREAEAYWGEVVSPLGVEHLEVVGVITFADQVLGDDLFPSLRMIVSPDVAARYDCVASEPLPGSTWDQVIAVMWPHCAVNFRYHSVRVAGGCGSCALETVLAEMTRRNAVLRDIPDLEAVNAMLAEDGIEPVQTPGYFLIPTETEREAARVAQAVRPTVAALLVLGLSAAVLGVVLASLLMAREVRRADADQRQWEQLGVGRRTRTSAVAAPSVAAIVLGGLAGGLAGWWLAPGPVGLVAVVAPPPSRHLALGAVAVAVGIAVVGVVLCGAVSARSTRSAHARRPMSSAPNATSVLTEQPLPVAVADGLRAAFGQRSAAPVIGGTAVLTAVFVAAALFASSLSALVSTPRSYGWPWDVAALTGYGYGGLDASMVAAALDDDLAVDGYSILGLSNDVTLGVDPMMTVIQLDAGNRDLTVLDGRAPIGRDEVALGASTAALHGVGVGDTVEVRRPVEVNGAPEPIVATVTGIVTFPVLGQFEAEHVSVGTGVLLPEASVGSDLARYSATFVGVELSGASRGTEAAARIRDLVSTFGWGGVLVFDESAIRPSQIADAASTRPVPVVVAAVFAGLLAISLATASWASVRSRRRHLAVLRALGVDSRQVRVSVHVHTVATTAAALVLGVPLGVIVGRALWRGFATELGVVPDPASSWGVVGISIVGGLVIALAAAVVPAALACRASPAAGLAGE